MNKQIVINIDEKAIYVNGIIFAKNIGYTVSDIVDMVVRTLGLCGDNIVVFH